MPPAEVTSAVKVTDSPLVDGFSDELTVVAVVAWFTFCVTTAEVLTASSVLPLYSAVIESLPTGSVAMEKVAFPELSVTVPREVVPFLKVTVPAGVPSPEVTVAANSTDLP
jgi:hypothetical protein